MNYIGEITKYLQTSLQFRDDSFFYSGFDTIAKLAGLYHVESVHPNLGRILPIHATCHICVFHIPILHHLTSNMTLKFTYIFRNFIFQIPYVTNRCHIFWYLCHNITYFLRKKTSPRWLSHFSLPFETSQQVS